jgi:hypothetical protein
MKKLLIGIVALTILVSVSTSDLFARGIGIKGGYGIMLNDYDDANYEDTFTWGIFFDVGHVLFRDLRFKPSVDFITLEDDNNQYADLWGIHFDWYWYFLGNAAISPFLGFGPSLNYYNYDASDADDDSDAGVDLFAGAAMGISGTPFELFLEARYKFIDIAKKNENIMVLGLGLQYRF